MVCTSRLEVRANFGDCRLGPVEVGRAGLARHDIVNMATINRKGVAMIQASLFFTTISSFHQHLYLDELVLLAIMLTSGAFGRVSSLDSLAPLFSLFVILDIV